MNTKNVIITAIVAVVFAGGGFWGGMQFQKGQRGNFPAGADGRFYRGNLQNGQNGARPGNFGTNRPVSGEITAMDDKSITIKTQDGSSVIVLYSSSTTVSKTTEGAISDLKTGDQITVMGTAGSAGTVTAQSIFAGSRMFLNRAETPAPTQNQ